MPKCDYCEKESEFYSTHKGGRLVGTLCDDCFEYIPINYFTDKWDGNCSEEFLLILLKLSKNK